MDQLKLHETPAWVSLFRMKVAFIQFSWAHAGKEINLNQIKETLILTKHIYTVDLTKS